jgi:hypothetical protein
MAFPISSASNAPRTLPTADDNGQTQARAQLTQLARAATPPTDPQAAAVGRQVDDMVKKKFGGDYKKAFQHYAGANGEVSRDGVKALLKDAGIGSDTQIPFIGSTRDKYADALMDKFDSNHNGSVSWQEFTGGMKNVGVNIGN